MKHPDPKLGLRYLVIQIHPDADPVLPQIQSNFLTGDGSLVAFTTDGYYADRDVAQGVADVLAERHPNLTTHVVEVLSTAGRNGATAGVRA